MITLADVPEAALPQEHHRLALIRRFGVNGCTRYRVNFNGAVYDVTEREYGLLQWGRTPAKLRLLPVGRTRR